MACLGHAYFPGMRARTFKPKFGHRGPTIPRKNLSTGRVEITANHDILVDIGSLNGYHESLNDKTCEGTASNSPVFSVQYHPEASSGPHDSNYLFDEFIALRIGICRQCGTRPSRPVAAWRFECLKRTDIHKILVVGSGPMKLSGRQLNATIQGPRYVSHRGRGYEVVLCQFKPRND